MRRCGIRHRNNTASGTQMPIVSHVQNQEPGNATPTLTLDTSCVSALANPSSSDDAGEVVALGDIIDLARAGRVKLQLTASYERDFKRDKDEPRRAERLDWLADAPPIPASTASGTMTFRRTTAWTRTR